jgi:hypothetical protein
MARVPLVASKIEQRAVIRFLWAKGISAAEILSEMRPVYGNMCLTLTAIRNWCRKLSSGRKSLDDYKRSGRRVSTTNNDVVTKIDDFIRADKCTRTLCREINILLIAG